MQAKRAIFYKTIDFIYSFHPQYLPNNRRFFRKNLNIQQEHALKHALIRINHPCFMLILPPPCTSRTYPLRDHIGCLATRDRASSI